MISEFSNVGWDRRVLLIVSVIFYFINIYQNIISCYTFYKNIYKIRDYLLSISKFLSYSINSITNINKYCGSSYIGFVAKNETIKNVTEVETVFVSPDAGGTVRARKFADMFGGDIAIVDKRRPKAGVSEVMNLIGEVEGAHAILVDDIIDSGGTLCNAAKAIMDAGALSVRAYITHGVLTGQACQKVEKSVLKELVITDSIEYKCPDKITKVRVVSVSQMFGEALRRVNNEESVSSLFAQKI